MHLVFAVCMKYLKNSDSDKDATMEIFESLDNKLIKFEVRNFKGWIHKVSRNYCLMELRKRKVEIGIEEVKKNQSIDVENSITLHPANEESIYDINIAGFLKQLKTCQRECLEMMYFKDMSYKTIAIKTGYSQKQVKSYIQNGKRKLKILLSER